MLYGVFMGHLISVLVTAYVLYMIGGGLWVLVGWIFTKWQRVGVTAVFVGLLSAWMYSIPDPPPIDNSYSAPVYQEETKPAKPQYVTQILGTDSTGNRIEKRITLAQCKSFSRYSGVVYGICVIN